MNRRRLLSGIAATLATGHGVRAQNVPPGVPRICGATMLCDGDAPTIPRSGPAAPRRLYVDLGGAMLYAAEGDALAFASRVIVGAARTPTPEADTVLDHVRFRPTWRPTPRMVASGDYEDGLRPPGPNNPLGLAAVRFRGGGLVYLHGTNRPALFGRERRALSNGCVRVERLERMVAWCLGWTDDAALAAMNGRRTYDEPAPEIPLVMTRRADHPAIVALSGMVAAQDAA